MKYCFSLVFALVFGFGLLAQKGCEILVRLDNYTYDTLWFGTTVGKRVVPDIAALRQPDGTFLLKTEQQLEQGMYAIVYKRASNAAYQSFQVWLKDGERKFSITTSFTTPYDQPTILGSNENVLLYRYLSLFRTADATLDDAITKWRYHQDEATWQQRVTAEADFRKFQDDFLATAQPGLTANLVSQTLLVLPPASHINFNDWRKEAEERWAYQRAHFFDKMNIATTSFLQNPQWLDRADFFLLYLPPPHPDTTKALIDLVFKRLEAYPEGYDYYNKYLFNSLSKMSQYRLDEVYVHFVRNYLTAGKAKWATEAEIKTAVNTANGLEMLFEGRAVPPVTMFDKASNPVKLYDIQANLTLLLFYMPDCSHCKKEIPIIAKLYEKYKPKGLKVVAVCLKTFEDAPQCWDFIDTQNLPSDWYLLADPERKSNLAVKYNVKSYPKLYLLDADKKILYKRSGDSPEWQMDAVLGGF